MGQALRAQTLMPTHSQGPGYPAAPVIVYAQISGHSYFPGAKLAHQCEHQLMSKFIPENLTFRGNKVWAATVSWQNRFCPFGVVIIFNHLVRFCVHLLEILNFISSM